MLADLVVRSTRVLTAEGLRPAAVHVRGGRISQVADLDDPVPAATFDDCGTDVVMPGLVDTHVHVNDPGRADWEGWETATAAAAAGGVTTIVDMPLNSIPATTTLASLETKRQAARFRTHVDVAFWGGVVPGNRAEVQKLATAGVAGFKAFLVPSGVDEFAAVCDRDLRESLPILASAGLPLLVHAESPSVIARAALALEHGDPRRYGTWLSSRPEEAELEAIALIVDLCREFRTPIHIVHLATPAGLGMIRDARHEGLPLSVETCPHYLTFAAEDVPDGATLFKCAPPIRGRVHRDALWQAVMDGRIDLIATDHSPCPPAMKRLDTGDFARAWGGIASLELSLPVTWTGASARGVCLEWLAQLLCAAPARLAGLAGRKGTLQPGCDADMVVWDPDAQFTVEARSLAQRHKLTPYDGMVVRGVIQRTYLRGRLVHRRGMLASTSAPFGQLLERRHS
jgi:allantoinase